MMDILKHHLLVWDLSQLGSPINITCENESANEEISLIKRKKFPTGAILEKDPFLETDFLLKALNEEKMS